MPGMISPPSFDLRVYSGFWNGYINLKFVVSMFPAAIIRKGSCKMIFLTNEHVQQVLDMKTCIDAMEDAYRELNEERAGYRPRIDFYVPQEPHYYRWGTMEGASRNLGVFAIRMKSDMLAWENQDGFMVE
ncbi:MAG: hypothetical protein OEN50_00815, partial [Deltaproteobacteria bacterium]|nr:hypothetical protein [Deltaproteobacteria bacterium]